MVNPANAWTLRKDGIGAQEELSHRGGVRSWTFPSSNPDTTATRWTVACSIPGPAARAGRRAGRGGRGGAGGARAGPPRRGPAARAVEDADLRACTEYLRIQHIVALAEEEAEEILTEARTELDNAHRDAERIRSEAYADAVNARRDFELALSARRRHATDVDEVLKDVRLEPAAAGPADAEPEAAGPLGEPVPEREERPGAVALAPTGPAGDRTLTVSRGGSDQCVDDRGRALDVLRVRVGERRDLHGLRGDRDSPCSPSREPPAAPRRTCGPSSPASSAPAPCPSRCWCAAGTGRPSRGRSRLPWCG